MRHKEYYFQIEDLDGFAFRVKQLMERAPDGSLRGAPDLDGRGDFFASFEELQEALCDWTGADVRLTLLRDDESLPSTPSAPQATRP